MQNSPACYQFSTSTSTLPGMSHSPHPLQLLAYTNKGNARASDKQIRLNPVPLENTLTIGHLAGDRNRFAKPDICIESNRWIINFGKFSPLSLDCCQLTRKCLQLSVAVVSRLLLRSTRRLRVVMPVLVSDSMLHSIVTPTTGHLRWSIPTNYNVLKHAQTLLIHRLQSLQQYPEEAL